MYDRSTNTCNSTSSSMAPSGHQERQQSVSLPGTRHPISDLPILWLVGDGIEILWPKESCPTGRAEWRNYIQDKDKTRLYSHSYDRTTGEGTCEVEWNCDGFVYSTRWRPADSGRYGRRRRVSDYCEDIPTTSTSSAGGSRKRRGKNRISRRRNKKRKLADWHGANGNQTDQGEADTARYGTSGGDPGASSSARRRFFQQLDTSSAVYASMRQIAASAALAAIQKVEGAGASGAALAEGGNVAPGEPMGADAIEEHSGLQSSADPDPSAASSDEAETSSSREVFMAEPTPTATHDRAARHEEATSVDTDLPPIPPIANTLRRVSHEAGEIAPNPGSPAAANVAGVSYDTEEYGTAVSDSDDEGETTQNDFSAMIAAKYLNVPEATPSKPAEGTAEQSPAKLDGLRSNTDETTSPAARRSNSYYCEMIAAKYLNAATPKPAEGAAKQSPAKPDGSRCNTIGRTSRTAHHCKSVASLAEAKGRKKRPGQQHTESLRRASTTSAEDKHDNENHRVCDEIKDRIASNRDLWEHCKGSMQRKQTCKHPEYIRTVHTGDSELEEEDEEAKAFMSFERTYSQVKVICKDDDGLLLYAEQSRPLSIMVRGLAKRIPPKYDDFISAKEETGEGFILDYKIGRSIWRLVGDEERSQCLQGFRDHLRSIAESLKETTRWLQEPAEWNTFLLGMVDRYAVSKCSTGRKGWSITRAGVVKLEQALRKRKPDELEKVMNWEYDLT